jgi:cysteine desulfurase / selenocysteine lyase
MTIAEILANEELRQHEFPVTREKVFLAHAAVCPLPRRVGEAISEYALGAVRDDQETGMLPDFLTQSRGVAAKLLHCQAGEIAFVGPTSLGLSLMAASLPFRKHDNILICFDDYPSNVYPWMKLAERGVEVRLMNTRQWGTLRSIDIMGQVDENTRAVVMATCHFVSGYRLEIEKVGRYLRQRGIWFGLDAIQTLGAFPTTVEHVDFLAADAHKWLLGPCAAGVLYVRRELIAKCQPPVYGWHNVHCPNFIAQEQIVLREDARRFEAGSHNLLSIVGLRAAMELALELDPAQIGRELLRKRALLVPALQAKGFTVLNAEVAAENAGGIVTCFKPGADMAALHTTLTENKVVASLRMDRAGQRYLRFSPHFYNTDAELLRAVELL